MGGIWTRNKWKTDGKGAHGKLGSMLGEGGAFRERMRRAVRARWWRAWPQEGKGQGGRHSGPGERSPAWQYHGGQVCDSGSQHWLHSGMALGASKLWLGPQNQILASLV